MHHLVAQDDFVGSLENPHAVAVQHRQDRSNEAAGDAAVVEREILELVERAGPERSAIAVGGTRTAGCCHRRHLSVWRIDDERRVPERPDAELIAKDCFLIDRAIPRAFVTRCAASELLGREQLSRPVLRRAAHLNAAHVVARPDAFEIGMSPRGPRRFPVRILRLGRRRLGGNRAQAPSASCCRNLVPPPSFPRARECAPNRPGCPHSHL